MREFEYKYKDYPYRVKPWNYLISQETSWIIFWAYKNNLVDSKDVWSLVLRKIAFSSSNIGFCFGAYYFSGIFLRKNVNFIRFLTKETLLLSHIGATLISSYAYMKLNPLVLLKNHEKTKILEFLDNNLAWDILKLNNMIPRW